MCETFVPVDEEEEVHLHGEVYAVLRPARTIDPNLLSFTLQTDRLTMTIHFDRDGVRVTPEPSDEEDAFDLSEEL